MHKYSGSLSILIILIVIFSSCNKLDEDEIIENSGAKQSISAKINGEDFSASGILVTAQYSNLNEMVHSLAIGGAELPFNGVTRAIALAIVSADSTEINQGEIYTAISNSKIGAGEYAYDNNSIDIKAVSENTDIATITITKIDYDKKLVSGTFSFDGSDEDDPGTIYQIRDGVFTDVSFE